MAKLIYGLKKPLNSSVVLPAGRYTVDVADVRLIEHKSNDGKSINVSYRVDAEGGKYHGTYVNSYHIVDHSSEKAVEIGMEELARIAVALGRDLSDEEANVDLSSFKGKSLVVRLDDPEEGRSVNPVSGFYSL